MMKALRFVIIMSLPVVILFFSDCKREGFGNGKLSFSTDTLTFDTVFTTLGSTTMYFTVHNTSSQAIKISDIRLLHLLGNQFRINVDGDTVPLNGAFSNVQIPARDSIYVFAEVTINPNNASNPFVVYDDVQFTVNGNIQKVHLQAFGQNAHFHYGEELKSGTMNWNNDLPHIIIGNNSNPGVLVDCGATLNINKGCKIYFAPGAGIFVQGNLNAIATNWSDSIVFRGDRLESYYTDQPGQWFGIVFLRDSLAHCNPTGSFNHCIINESQYGIYAGAGLSGNLSTYLGTASQPVISITRTVVKNCQYNAVYGFNANISANNSLFYAAGEYMMKFGLGGTYTFNNCTMYNNGSLYVDHQNQTLLLSNFVTDGTNTTYASDLKTQFQGNVIYGSLDNEISFNKVSAALFTNQFISNAVKSYSDSVTIFSTVNQGNIFNQDPRFVDPTNGNFTPSDSIGYFSPLIDQITLTGTDLWDHGRSISKSTRGTTSDIGAVEAQ